MKKIISMLLVVSMLVLSLAACKKTDDTKSKTDTGSDTQNQEATDPVDDVVDDVVEQVKKEEGYSVGFVTFGLGGDFFQSLADTFVEKMTEAGWKAQYADGAFNPTTQIEAFENFIAMEVDVIVVWSVAPEAMDTVVKTAMDKGIKVINFVAPTSQYDVLMISDEEELAVYCAKLAAKWIDTTYADAEDHSVPVAVLSCRLAETGVTQADVLIKIEEFSKKAKFVTEIECADENMDTGMKTAENLYISNPEIKVFLSAHNGLALGVNNYYTAISSPVTDYSDMGIFTINGDVAIAEIIKTSADDKAPLRGMVLTGSVDDTATEIRDMCIGIMDGSVKPGFIQKAGTTFVNVESVDEYLETGKVTSLTAEDFK
ncbi:MAG: sugar ABC transporter substrate-binding protein [Thermoanaerobacteraceae bacterium]|nr:sugar ABC transporter substrate-binding protein [Thermoanaerobacteraceae bacterium]